MSRSRPTEAEGYVSPFKNKGDNFDDNSDRHRTNRVWSVYSIPRKTQGTKVTQKVKRNTSPFQATKDGPRKRHSPKAAERGLLDSFYDNDEYETAKSSWLAAPAKRVRITATPEEIIVEDTCLKFDDDQWGSWNAPNCEAIKASNCKDPEEEQFKEINIPVHCNPEFLYSDHETLSTVSSYSDNDSAGNAFPEEFIDVFQVLIENDDDAQTT